MNVDYCYKLLGLQFPSTRDEIKKAFHRLAHVHHPDKGGDAETFKKINNAYQFLIQKGYWDMLAKEEAKRASPAGYARDIRASRMREEYWSKRKKEEEAKESAWRPHVFCSEDGSMFWTENSDGFVTYSWTKDEATDGTSWRDLDDSESFKDYTKHLKS